MLDMQVDEAIASGWFYSDPTRKYALFQQLRRDDPVHWTEPAGYRPFWTVTRHADIMEIERGNDRFLNQPRSRLVSIEFERRVAELMQGRPLLVQSMHSMDGERHRAFRQITASWFMPRQMKLVEGSIAALAREAVDELLARAPTLDFYKDVAVWYPLRVLMLMLGLPEKDAPLLQRLTASYFGGSDPQQQTAGDVIDAAQAFRLYFRDIVAHRRKHPTEDVASIIANAKIDGEYIEEYLVSSYYIALASAGHDTTSASIAGGVLAMVQSPVQWARLKNDPALIPSAVEEMIRWVAPINHFFRTAREDCDFRGRRIKAGESLMMVYPSGNRDDAAFEAPDTFRVDRAENRHLAFGFGVHMCLGALLARHEMQSLFRELIGRVKHFELAGSPAWVETTFVGGLKTLPVKVTAA